MKILVLPRFERQYKKLPDAIREIAKDKVNIFTKEPFDPRLKTHKLHGKLAGQWSFMITHSYRIIFEFVDTETARFYSIGNHDIYE